MHHLNRLDIQNRLRSIQSCSPMWMFGYQAGAMVVVIPLLMLSTHWMLSLYAVTIQVLALAAYRLFQGLRQPLPTAHGSATELATLLVDRITTIMGKFWFLCGCALMASALGVVMAWGYGSTYLLAALPLFMSMPWFARLRSWSALARRVCLARKMETFDRFHVVSSPSV